VGPRYRSPGVQGQIQDLALRVTAGATTPYDKAAAIESYLRTNFEYTLAPPPPPAGPESDAMEFFLFNSKKGYCEYFASAMGDMLRSLGIPARLVSGYGPGTFDERSGRWVVHESDAHVWVEVYFPGYGWQVFEPTADGTYFPIQRSTSNDPNCNPELADCSIAGDPGAVTDPAQRPIRDDSLDQSGLGGGGGFQWPSPAILFPSLAGLLLLGLLAYVWISRFLRPKTVGGVWRRTGFLVRLAGIKVIPGETPHEYGRRLAKEIPEAGSELTELARSFAIAAYAPATVAARSRTSIMAAWESLRPQLLRRVVQRFSPG
jgi:hypothetical protein